MQIVMLLDWIQWPIHHFNHFQNQIVDLKLCVKKIQDFLAQPEVEAAKPQEKKADHGEHAIWIENQNFSWGVQTMDVDELFRRMRLELRGET